MYPSHLPGGEVPTMESWGAGKGSNPWPSMLLTELLQPIPGPILKELQFSSHRCVRETIRAMRINIHLSEEEAFFFFKNIYFNAAYWSKLALHNDHTHFREFVPIHDICFFCFFIPLPSFQLPFLSSLQRFGSILSFSYHFLISSLLCSSPFCLFLKIEVSSLPLAWSTTRSLFLKRIKQSRINHSGARSRCSGASD